MPTFEKYIWSSPLNGQQLTPKKVCGSSAFGKSIWFPPKMASNQPRRFQVAAACPPSRSPFSPSPQMASNQLLRMFAACPPSKKCIWFPPRMAGYQPRGFKVAAVCPPLRSPSGLPPHMAGNQLLRRFAACLPSKRPFGFSSKWLAISQEDLKWLLRACLWEVHLVFPPKGQLSTAKKVSSGHCFSTFIIVHAESSINCQPSRIPLEGLLALKSKQNGLLASDCQEFFLKGLPIKNPLGFPGGQYCRDLVFASKGKAHPSRNPFSFSLGDRMARFVCSLTMKTLSAPAELVFVHFYHHFVQGRAWPPDHPHQWVFAPHLSCKTVQPLQ
jgi:hypothetical protein